jgi:hypothetical protein
MTEAVRSPPVADIHQRVERLDVVDLDVVRAMIMAFIRAGGDGA